MTYFISAKGYLVYLDEMGQCVMQCGTHTSLVLILTRSRTALHGLSLGLNLVSTP